MDNNPQEVPQVKSVEENASEYCKLKQKQGLGSFTEDDIYFMKFAHMAGQQISSDRIAELEKQNAELKNIIEFDLNHGFEMEAENKRLKGILERVRSMSSSVSLENNRKIRFFITEALNSNEKQ